MIKFDTLDDAIEHTRIALRMVTNNLLRVMWDVGETAQQIREDAKYGENAIKRFARGIGRRDSWVYECIKLRQAYEWEVIEEKFINTNIAASSVARLACIGDVAERNWVETRVIANVKTGYDDIATLRKAYAQIVGKGIRWEIGDQVRKQVTNRAPDPAKKTKIVYLKVRVEIEYDGDEVPVDEVVWDMDYGMRSQTPGATIISTEIRETMENPE